MSLRAKRHDRTEGPVVCRLWTKTLRRADFQDFFVAVRSFTATDANGDEEDNATAHFTFCVALHN